MLYSRRAKLGAIFTLTLVMGMTGCKNSQSPVDFSLRLPDADHVEFDARLKQKYGLGISGEFDLKDIGTVLVMPETGTKGFGLGLRLNSGAFVRKTFGTEYQEVGTLPTGAGFPEWLPSPVMDVTSSKLDSKDIKWHFYFGVRGAKSVGVAAVLKAVNEDIPSVNIGYVFYDKKGNVVLGVQFFGPKVSGGTLVENGGVLVGTNLSPLFPSSGKEIELGAEGVGAVAQALSGGPVVVGGRTVSTSITVSGSGARKLKSKAAFNRVMKQFIRATQ